MTYKLTLDDLEKHLAEHISFLMRSAHAFDDGYYSEAKRIAVSLRLLLHDTAQSISLLNQLGKKSISFYETSLNIVPGNLASTLGLINVRFGKDGVTFNAPLDDGAPTRYRRGKLPFDDWWDKVVFIDQNNNRLTRKELVLAVANKDGGAHVDQKLNKAYADITKRGSLGFTFMKCGEEVESIIPAEMASIRQICHEVIKTLKDEFPTIFVNL